MQNSLNVYNDVFERAKTITKLDDAKDFLENREKQTYLLDGVSGLEIIRDGMKILFDVVETDDHLLKKGLPRIEKEFFIPKFVWNHLVGFLSIPNRVFDYYQRFRDLSNEDFIRCQECESEVLQILFNDRLDQQKKNTRIKELYLTVFNDGFGEFPRVIHSELYYPFRDYEALTMLLDGFLSVNREHNDRDYAFKNAYISPYSSEFRFTNEKTKTPTVRGEEIESGVSVQNSECKYASFNFQAYILRLQCLNGATSRYNDTDLRVKHYEHGFKQKIANAFRKALHLENDFARKYMDSVKYNEKLSNDWADLLDIPKSILAMNPNEKEELVEIGRTQDYDFTPYGVLQALTYKSSHRSHNDSTKDRINEKACIVLDNIEELSEWIPEN